MTDLELWNEYCKECHIDIHTPHDAYSFGDDPKYLAELVLSGKKTATSFLYDLYALEHEPLPEVGDISIILNDKDDAICIIRNKKVYTMKFSDVMESFASKEGEGDCTLKYWRAVHESFFKKEALEYGLSFHENMLIVCKEFEVIYKN